MGMGQKYLLSKELEDIIIIAKKTKWEKINKLFAVISETHAGNRFSKHYGKGKVLDGKKSTQSRNKNDEKVNYKSGLMYKKIYSIAYMKKMMDRNMAIIEVPSDYVSKYKDIYDYIYGDKKVN